MPHRALKSFYDIFEAATFILDVAEGETFESYSQDLLKRRAVERSFEIIGEAMRRLRDSDPDLLQQFTDAPRIIGFRNFLIHGYDLINHEIAWMTIQQYLPTLLAEIQTATARLQSEYPDQQ